MSVLSLLGKDPLSSTKSEKVSPTQYTLSLESTVRELHCSSKVPPNWLIH